MTKLAFRADTELKAVREAREGEPGSLLGLHKVFIV